MTKPTELMLHESKVELPGENIADHVRKMIALVGEDPNREGLRKTPERFEKAFKFLTSGYHQNLDSVMNGATFSVAYDEMVVVKDIEFFSLCEHHLLPFFGKAHVAYLPNSVCLDSARSPAWSTCLRGVCKFKSALPARSHRRLKRRSARKALA
jgi:GTP cyclohydrolase I